MLSSKAASKQEENTVLQQKYGAMGREVEEEQLLATFVGGKKQGYYQEKWAKEKATWNWAAFFLGFMWLGYRKMYGLIFLIIGVFLTIDVAVVLMGMDGSSINSAIGMGLSAFVGIYGNMLYRNHAGKKINALRDYHRNDEELQEAVKKRGGTSWLGVAAAAAMLIGYLFVAGFVTQVIFSIIG